ncbi:alpha-amylase family protein [Leptothoe sp. LEGE 181152]|uniref:Alpha-amylase n=1 Tax=Adonisia turfae CCMR0081 TaxID=2292702 RepID=A0A6M0RLP2_9CYAN|nr:alpha-amylase family protein [Adonisia turfae]MDV3353821.1 alpha-amylase family protein [Leptothoe sp. LEGE 181152]NEZ57178.1 alpha-amylase [Adonisia turfae CCMR0081]
MFRKLATFCLTAVTVAVTVLLSANQPAQANVILHAFDWSYATVTERAPAIAAAGYGAVLVTPPLKSPITQECRWYQRYQPQDFRVISNCDGDKESFVAMINALSKVGVLTYADVVVNHMANERNGSTTFPGMDVLDEYAEDPDYWERQRLYGDLDGGLFNSQDFHAPKCIRNYGNRDEVVKGRICGAGDDPGLPDLRDTVSGDNWVLEQRKHYVQTLYDLGVRGFRVDAAKHMPNAAIRYFIPDEIANNTQIFAEIITTGGVGDHEYNLFLEPYLRELPASFAAYDFPLLNAIKQAFSVGRPLSEIAQPYDTGNALENSRAVTVVTTHDIPYNDPFRYLILDPVDEDLAYAYIMGRDGGTPMVFDDGTTAAPPFGQTDGGRWQGVWNRDRMVRMITFHNRMQGISMEVLHADDCTLLWRREEEGIVAINKCEEPRKITVDTQFKFKWFHPYQDSLTEDPPIEITESSFTFEVPARRARMWFAI